MSKAKDIARAVAGHPVRHGEPAHPLTLRCGKCKAVVSEAFVAQHLIDCQHGKAECGKCKKYIDAHEFVKHFKECPGV